MSSFVEKKDFIDLEDISNGLVLSNIYLPEEILVNLFIFVSWKDLMSFRLVCQSWRRIIDSVVCFEKLKKFNFKTLTECFTDPLSKPKSDSIPFNLYFAISNGAFGKNLLKNPFGSGNDPHICHVNQNSSRVFILRARTANNYINRRLCSQNDCPRYLHWGILESGGEGWAVEPEPLGSQPLPSHFPERSCYVTSYSWCKKEQLISLKEHGLTSKIMDEVQPQFDISEWYARRWDCRIRYKLVVLLLDCNKEVLQKFKIKKGENLEDNEWHEVSHSFKEYGPGVRFIKFIHAGVDGQFWAGHYGSKIAGGSVIARIPTSRFERSCDSTLLNES